MDRGRPQERPDPNPSYVDRRGGAVGLLPSFGVKPMAIATLEEYLREFSVEIAALLGRDGFGEIARASELRPISIARARSS